jgi:hypothetical protein
MPASQDRPSRRVPPVRTILWPPHRPQGDLGARGAQLLHSPKPKNPPAARRHPLRLAPPREALARGKSVGPNRAPQSAVAAVLAGGIRFTMLLPRSPPLPKGQRTCRFRSCHVHPPLQMVLPDSSAHTFTLSHVRPSALASWHQYWSPDASLSRSVARAQAANPLMPTLLR